MVPVAAVLLLAGACTSDGLDDGTSADVILEILSLTNPAVTGAISQDGTCSVTTATTCMGDADCPLGESCVFGCTLTVVDWNADIAAQPKNTLASPPFNDIVLIDVTVTYDWINGTAMPPRTFGLGGVTIPAGGSASVAFQPIAFDDLSTSIENSTANLTLMFRAQTVEGSTINATVLRALNVESCDQ